MKYLTNLNNSGMHISQIQIEWILFLYIIVAGYKLFYERQELFYTFLHLNVLCQMASRLSTRSKHSNQITFH